MKEFLNILKNIISTIDWIYASIIILSLFGGLLLQSSSVKLILISIAILFLIALISSLAQKFSDYYSNFQKSSFSKNYNYEITTQNSNTATRKTIENFDNKDDYKINTKNESDENSEESIAAEQSNEKSKFYYFDELSSVRIIRKIDEFEYINKEGQNMENNPINIEDSSNSHEEMPQENLEQTSHSMDNAPNIEPEINDNTDFTTSDEPQDSSELSNQINLNFEKVAMNFPINTFFENHPLFGNEPKQELEYFLNRILMIIKASISANTIGLFFLNPNEKKLNLFSFITENNDLLSPKRDFSIDNDILSEILTNAKPEILSEINYSAILDILPYYAEPVEIRSFAGVPIFLNEKVVGILTLDSIEANCFDSNVIGYIGNFTKLISSILTSLNEKFELIVSAKTLDAVNSMQMSIKKENISFENILKNIFEAISKILKFENIGFCNFSSQSNAWTIQAVQGKEEFVKSLHNAAIDTQNGLIKKTLFDNETLFLSPINNHKNIINNKIEFDSNGYFLAVPLKSIGSSYGAIFVYGENHDAITNYDVQILNTLANNAAATIEQFLYIKVFSNYAQIDPRYGILNTSALFNRLNEEIARAKDFNYPISFATIMIDELDTLKSKGFDIEALYNILITNLNANIRPYNLLGEVDERIIAVVLNYIDLKELRIWCEKIRSEIAQVPININGKKIIMTLSIGAATLDEDDDIDKLTAKSLKMLQASLNKSNTVSIY